MDKINIKYTASDAPFNAKDLINEYANIHSYSFSVDLFKEFAEKTKDNPTFMSNYLSSKFYDCYKMIPNIEFSSWKIHSYKEIYLSLLVAGVSLDAFMLFLSQIPDSGTFTAILNYTKLIQAYVESLEIDDQFAIKNINICDAVNDNCFENVKKLTISKPDLICISSGNISKKSAQNLVELDISKADASFIGAAMLYSSLEKIKLPETLVNIPDFAFDGKKSLKEITIPKSVTKIGLNAFNMCSDDLKIEVSKKSDILVPESDIQYLKDHIVWKK